MTVAHLESVVGKCAGQVEHNFVRFHFLVAFGARGRACDQQEDRQCNRESHLFSLFCWISSITCPTASLTLRTSSMLGALPGGNVTSFSIQIGRARVGKA